MMSENFKPCQRHAVYLFKKSYDFFCVYVVCVCVGGGDFIIIIIFFFFLLVYFQLQLSNYFIL